MCNSGLSRTISLPVLIWCGGVLALAVDSQRHGAGFVDVHFDPKLFQIQNDLSNVLVNARNDENSCRTPSMRKEVTAAP